MYEKNGSGGLLRDTDFGGLGEASKSSNSGGSSSSRKGCWAAEMEKKVPDALCEDMLGGMSVLGRSVYGDHCIVRL